MQGLNVDCVRETGIKTFNESFRTTRVYIERKCLEGFFETERRVLYDEINASKALKECLTREMSLRVT